MRTTNDLKEAALIAHRQEKKTKHKAHSAIKAAEAAADKRLQELIREDAEVLAQAVHNAADRAEAMYRINVAGQLDELHQAVQMAATRAEAAHQINMMADIDVHTEAVSNAAMRAEATYQIMSAIQTGTSDRTGDANDNANTEGAGDTAGQSTRDKKEQMVPGAWVEDADHGDV